MAIKLIEILRKRLIENGYQPQTNTDGVVNSYRKLKSWPNAECSVTLYPDHFNVYYREYPLKEGWEIKDYKYSRKNVNNKWYWL